MSGTNDMFVKERETQKNRGDLWIVFLCSYNTRSVMKHQILIKRSESSLMMSLDDTGCKRESPQSFTYHRGIFQDTPDCTYVSLITLHL